VTLARIRRGLKSLPFRLLSINQPFLKRGIEEKRYYAFTASVDLQGIKKSKNQRV
jgi:hypothetical protein